MIKIDYQEDNCFCNYEEYEMAAISFIQRTARTVSTLPYLKPLERLIRPFSSTRTLNFNEIKGYERLLKSSDREKVIAIAKTHLLDEQANPFLNNKDVTSQELFDLIDQVVKTVSFPIKEIGNFHENREFLHFRDNFTFVNLPLLFKL